MKTIRTPFGGVDEMATQEEMVAFVGGTYKADRLMQLLNNSYPTGTVYDRMMKRPGARTKQETFAIKAKQEGFTDDQINVFLQFSGG